MVEHPVFNSRSNLFLQFFFCGLFGFWGGGVSWTVGTDIILKPIHRLRWQKTPGFNRRHLKSWQALTVKFISGIFLPYLSGFVWVFHSGGLLYVDFRCIHTSRLLEEWEESHELTHLKLNVSPPQLLCNFATVLPVPVKQIQYARLGYVKWFREVSRTMCQMLVN